MTGQELGTEPAFCIHAALPWLMGVEGWSLQAVEDRAEPESKMMLEALEEKLSPGGEDQEGIISVPRQRRNQYT